MVDRHREERRDGAIPARLLRYARNDGLQNPSGPSVSLW